MRPDRSRERRRDAVLECLSARERRHAVRTLRDRGAVTLDELAAAVADEQTTRTGRLELALHHTHLPKLADAGLVEYDRERRVVEPTARTDAAVDALQSVDEEAEPLLGSAGSGPVDHE